MKITKNLIVGALFSLLCTVSHARALDNSAKSNDGAVFNAGHSPIEASQVPQPPRPGDKGPR